MNVLDIFSGIGGFSIGLERAGMRTVAFCEIDAYRRQVLAERWPTAPCYPDVRGLSAVQLAADGISVDVICGGFPCQDVSSAGTRVGLAGQRSGLWREFARLIGEIRPRYAIVENVADLLNRGMGEVLGDMAAIGFDAEWHCISAAAVGADHVRDRVWIVAYPGQRTREVFRLAQSQRVERESRRFPNRRCLVWQLANLPASCGAFAGEPDVGRVVDGVPSRVDRLAALGDAACPQIAEIIGREIMNAERAKACG